MFYFYSLYIFSPIVERIDLTSIVVNYGQCYSILFLEYFLYSATYCFFALFSATVHCCLTVKGCYLHLVFDP